MDWTSLVQPELLLMIPFLIGVRVMVKYIPKFPTWFIPILLWIIAMVIAVLHVSISEAGTFSWRHIPSGLMQGTFMALATIGGEQTVKQLLNKGKQ